MARSRGRRTFRRSNGGQYGWATSVGIPPEPVSTNGEDTFTSIIVAGETDIEVRSVGNTHANLKRVVGDIAIHPGFESTSEVTVDEPVSFVTQVAYMMAIVDLDDPTEYSPWSPEALGEEKIVSHGILTSSVHRVVDAGGGGNNRYSWSVSGCTQTRVDVKSNRRIRANENLNLFVNGEGSTELIFESGVAGLVTWNLRALLWLP